MIGWTIASLDGLEGLAPQASKWIAIQADFHVSHRCQDDQWPAGITRVAFVGDEQALGYQPDGDRIVVLACRRAGVLGDLLR